MVLVVNLSAALRDAELARAKATIPDNLSFINVNSKGIKDDVTLERFLGKFNI